MQATARYLQVIAGRAHDLAVDNVVSLAALEHVAERIAQLLDALADERERRSQMVVALVDQGTARRDVAAAARISPKSVCAALAEYG